MISWSASDKLPIHCIQFFLKIQKRSIIRYFYILSNSNNHHYSHRTDKQVDECIFISWFIFHHGSAKMRCHKSSMAHKSREVDAIKIPETAVCLICLRDFVLATLISSWEGQCINQNSDLCLRRLSDRMDRWLPY